MISMTGPTRRETREALHSLLKSAGRIVELEDRLKKREAERENRSARDEERKGGAQNG